MGRCSSVVVPAACSIVTGYAPTSPVDSASSVAGEAAASTDTGRFSDVHGTTHQPAINDLAPADVVSGYADNTFRPGLPVTRAQATTVLVAAYEFVTGEDVPAGTDAFDDDGGAHETNTNAAAAMGWVHGVSEGTFVPGGDLLRGQTARMLARAAADLVDAEQLTLPD